MRLMQNPLLILPSLLFAVSLGASTNRDFPYYSPLEGEIRGDVLYRAALTRDILRHSESDPGQSRILNAEGDEVPFVVLKDYSPSRSYRHEVEISEYKAGVSPRIYGKLEKKTKPVDKMEFTIEGRDFHKSVDIYSSKDLKTWVKRGSGYILDYSSHINFRKTDVKFAITFDRYFRIDLRDVTEDEARKYEVILKYSDTTVRTTIFRRQMVTILRIMASHSVKDDTRSEDSVNLTPKIHLDDEGDTFFLLTNTPGEKLDLIVSDRHYFRKVSIFRKDDLKAKDWDLVSNAQLHFFPDFDEDENRTSVIIPRSGWKALKIVVRNRKNPPLKIEGIKIRWVRRYAFFYGQRQGQGPGPGSYRIYYGNELADSRDYDISRFVDQKNWMDKNFVTLKFGAHRENPDYVEPKEPFLSSRNWLTVVISLMVIVLAYWIFRLARSGESTKLE